MATGNSQAQSRAKAQAAAKKAIEVGTVAAVGTVVAATAIDLQALTHIVTATTSEVGFSYTPIGISAPLAAAGYVEVRTDVVDHEGSQATRATQAGIDYVASKASPFAAPATAQAPAVPEVRTRTVAKAPEGGFKLVAGIPIPPVSRSFGPKASVYPFDDLEVDISFFVAATEARPNPTKTLASTVNSASLRYAVEKVVDGETVLEKTRVFVIRRVEDGAPWGQPGVAGAAIFREA